MKQLPANSITLGKWLAADPNNILLPAEPSRPVIIAPHDTEAACGGGFDHWFKRWDGMMGKNQLAVAAHAAMRTDAVSCPHVPVVPRRVSEQTRQGVLRF